MPNPDGRALLLWLLAATLCGLAWTLLPPIPQPPQYHDFADRSVCFGVTGCMDIASNALFALAGLAGLRFLSGSAGRFAFVDRHEAIPYRLFFAATILIALGSGYYHLAPDNDRLVWDRAAIMLAQMSLFAAILCERLGPSAGLRLLPLLLAAGLGSVAWWGWSEANGNGDLRAYGLMQLYTMLAIPLLLRLYPPRYSGDRKLLAIIGLYLLALLCDLSDRFIAELTGAISGHTVKHAVAALAVYWVIVRLRHRSIL